MFRSDEVASFLATFSASCPITEYIRGAAVDNEPPPLLYWYPETVTPFNVEVLRRATAYLSQAHLPGK